MLIWELSQTQWRPRGFPAVSLALEPRVLTQDLRAKEETAEGCVVLAVRVSTGGIRLNCVFGSRSYRKAGAEVL